MFLLDPDRDAVALDAAAALLGREADIRAASDELRAGKGNITPVIVLREVG